jgi:hypothetical protein
VQITQRDCCDIYCYGIGCVFVGYNTKLKKECVGKYADFLFFGMPIFLEELRKIFV